MQPWFLSPTLTDEHNPFAELTCPRVLSRAITVTWLGPPLLQGGHVNKPSHSRLHVAAIRLFPCRRAESGHIVDKSSLSGRWVSREREKEERACWHPRDIRLSSVFLTSAMTFIMSYRFSCYFPYLSRIAGSNSSNKAVLLPLTAVFLTHPHGLPFAYAHKKHTEEFCRGKRGD